MTLALALKLLLVPIMAWLDRQRGTPRAHERITKLAALVGLGLGVVLLLPPAALWVDVLTVAGVALGYSFGFGQPIGAIVNPPGNEAYEWYQVGPLKRHPMLALFVRGALVGASVLGLYLVVMAARCTFGLPVAAFAALAPDVFARANTLAAAFALAFMCAPWFAVKLGRAGNAAWALQEYLRGGLAGAMLFAYLLGRAA